MLEVSGLTAKTEEGKTLLEGVSFSVADEEIHCVLGKNGSGKSTLAYCLMGLGRCGRFSGRVIFDGTDLSRMKTDERAREGITLAFQEPARFEGLTVKDFLLAPRKKKTGPGHSDDDLKKALKTVGLEEEFLFRRVDEKLSGGERKRIELASLIVMRPKLMILDEPDASLDIIVYNELYDLLLDIKKELGCAILLITHREEAGLIADRATLLEKGRVVASGSFRSVMRTYCSREGRQDRCLAFKLGKRN